MDYISRDDALLHSEIIRVYSKDYGNIDVVPVEYLADIPSADVQPIKHGRWISSGRDNDYNSYLRCSRCNHEIVMYRDSEKKPPNYCENCGARIDGDTND